jgi:opacity protein-like surface antigen
MKKTTSWLTIGLTIAIVQISFSQKRSDFIETDSSFTSAIDLVPGSSKENAQFVRKKSAYNEVRYYPHQLSRYGFKNGTVYVSKSISVSGQTKQVFLEKLQNGKLNLYYYTEKGIKTFFLERDSTVFFEIKNSDDFRQIIAQNTSDFSWEGGQIQLLRYNKNSFSKIVSFYNKGQNRPLPFRRFGILAGYRSTSLHRASGKYIRYLDNIDLTPVSSAAFGVFADLPIQMTDLSVNVGLNFSRSTFSYTYADLSEAVDVDLSHTAVSIPILLRYTMRTLTWRPFVNAGVIYSYHSSNESRFDVVSFSSTPAPYQSPLIADRMVGYSAGLGLQRNVSYRKIVGLEARYSRLATSQEKTLNKSHLEILTSYSF